MKIGYFLILAICLFFHRNMREYIVALFGSQVANELPQQDGDKKLNESHLSVFRCIMAQIQRSDPKTHCTKAVVQVTTHFLHHCKNAANEWGVAQILCEIVQFGCNVNDELFNVLY